MDLPVLRLGSRGEHVELFQHYLLGVSLYRGLVDGIYGPKSEAATRRFQAGAALSVDGIVGSRTWGAAMVRGLDVTVPDDRLDWPPPPPNPLASPSYGVSRDVVFGKIEFRADPTEWNPEQVEITNGWTRRSLTVTMIPQLSSLVGGPIGGNVTLHRKAVDPFRAWFDRIEKERMTGLLRSFGGTWVARFIRGSRSVLSNHCYGTAIDLNVPWNGLGQTPARAGSMGSVRELANLAPEYGIYWGGWYSRRKDGMHFELDPDFVK